MGPSHCTVLEPFFGGRGRLSLSFPRLYPFSVFFWVVSSWLLRHHDCNSITFRCFKSNGISTLSLLFGILRKLWEACTDFSPLVGDRSWGHRVLPLVLRHVQHALHAVGLHPIQGGAAAVDGGQGGSHRTPPARGDVWHVRHWGFFERSSHM